MVAALLGYKPDHAKSLVFPVSSTPRLDGVARLLALCYALCDTGTPIIRSLWPEGLPFDFRS